MKRLLVVALMPACGCLSVARIPVPERTVYADDGTVLERDWGAAMTHAARRVGAVPSMKLRWRLLSLSWTEPPPGLKGRALHDARERRVAAPFAFCGLLVAAPIDFVVDSAYAWRDHGLREGSVK